MEKLELREKYKEIESKKKSNWARIDSLKLPAPKIDGSFSAWTKGILGNKPIPTCPLCGANVIQRKNDGNIYSSCPICDYEHVGLNFEDYDY